MTGKRIISLFVLLLPLLFSCEREGFDINLRVGPCPMRYDRKVMLLYEAGFNSLSGDLAMNISTLKDGYLPGAGFDEDILLVFSHLRSGSYSNETAPVMTRLYQVNGVPVTDTLRVWPAGTQIADAAIVTEVLTWVRDEFPASGYGAVFSSHATGWLPEGYYINPKKYEGSSRTGSVWYTPPRHSFGQEYYDSGTKTSEIELHDFAAAIPYKLDYILFDACLMGTVEVAWELKDACSYVAFSPCEIPAAGFDYSTLTSHLLKQKEPDLKGVCEDYFARYRNDSAYGAAITMVDCGALDPLAAVCRDLFETYRSSIRSLSGSNVQVYDRIMGSKDFYVFFDLKDLLREAGATDLELSEVQDALDQALVYEAHTDRFISVDLTRTCGLAVYLPAYADYRRDIWHGTKFLDTFYKDNVAWNDATLLVE